ncbi:MAG: fimbrial biogenesis chaperone [Rhodanobacter sp.]
MSPFRRVITLLLGLGLCTLAQAQVALSPQIADISLNGPSTTHTFRLSNQAKLPMHVVVTVHNWDMDIDGRVSTIPSTAQSLDPWVEINPTTFTVDPGQSQVVRYAIRPAVALTPGEHRAMVFFTEKPMPGDTPKPATLRAYFRLGAAIYAHVGPVHESGQITRFTADAGAALFSLHNTGNATTRMRGQYALWQAKAYPKREAVSPAQLEEGYKPPSGLVAFGRLPQDAVLPGADRHVTLKFGQTALSAGHYVLQVQGTLGATAIDRGLRFDVGAGHSK